MVKEIKVSIRNEIKADGIARFVQLANGFSSTVYLEAQGVCRVNAKSIMGMMGLPWEDGLRLIIRAEGEDEEKAVRAIAAYLTGKE